VAVRSVGGWAWLRADLDVLGERKISDPLPRIEFLCCPYTQHGLSCARLSSAVCGDEISFIFLHNEIVDLA
jgi:hypothetical protein